MCNNRNWAYNGVSKSRIFVGRVLEGIACTPQEIKFNSLSFVVDCLDQWIAINGLDIQDDWENRTKIITYKEPENLSYSLVDGMQLKICLGYNYSSQFLPTTEFKVKQKLHLELSSNNLRPLEEFIDIAHKLNQFMCFAIGTTVSIKNLVAKSKEIFMEMDPEHHIPKPIHIYYESIPYSEKVPQKIAHQMPFTYQFIEARAKTIINKWLRAYKTLAPALYLYFSANAQKYLEGKFLALVQGLEGFQRRSNNEKKEIILIERLNALIEPFKDYFGNCDERKKLLKKLLSLEII